MAYQFPPHLPDRYKQYPDYWVGTYNEYGPWLSVESQATVSDIVEASQTNGTVVMRLYTRNASMSDSEPDDDLGLKVLEIGDVFPNHDEEGTINFFAVTEHIFGIGKTAVWVWEYSQCSAAADFAAE